MITPTKPNLFEQPKMVVFFATLCGILWGSAYPGIKTGYRLFAIGVENTPEKLLFAGIRFTLAGLLVLGWFALTSRKREPQPHGHGHGHGFPHHSPGKINGKIFGKLLFLGLIQTTLHYTFFYLGLSRTPGALGSILNSSGVFFSVLLAHIIYHNDKLHAKKIMGIVSGFLGVVLVNFNSSLRIEFNFFGEGFIIIAALLMASSTLYGRKLSQHIHPALVTGSQLFMGGLVLVGIGFFMGSGWLEGNMASWLILLYLSVLSALAFTLWTTLLKHNKVSTITVYNFVIPLSGTILSAVVLNESIIHLPYLIALPLVILGIVFVNSREKPSQSTIPEQFQPQPPPQ